MDQIPQELTLHQNYPNPFNPNTTIKWEMPKAGSVTLKIYDVLGNEVATIINEEFSAGKHEVEFSSHSGEGRNLPAGRQGLTSGVFFYQIRSGDFIQTKKMILIK